MYPQTFSLASSNASFNGWTSPEDIQNISFLNVNTKKTTHTEVFFFLLKVKSSFACAKEPQKSDRTGKHAKANHQLHNIVYEALYVWILAGQYLQTYGQLNQLLDKFICSVWKIHTWTIIVIYVPRWNMMTYANSSLCSFLSWAYSFSSFACSDFNTSIWVFCTIPLPPPQVSGRDVWGRSLLDITENEKIQHCKPFANDNITIQTSQLFQNHLISLHGIIWVYTFKEKWFRLNVLSQDWRLPTFMIVNDWGD